MVTPYFNKLCHSHTWLLNAPYPNCRSKNRGIQNFELHTSQRPIDFISG
ncbi:unnamed protein product [Callosobruchus maculatus]|uniref:Uncharacterized protein n=1 Tax=Callosobruchus maculatus TaxID=64391 RepID=A0A653D4E0_CALMS|nr:unnamed protein product [Callosobruchus maculatus]